MHKTLVVIDCKTNVQNILQPSFVGPMAFAYNAYAIIRPQANSVKALIETQSSDRKYWRGLILSSSPRTRETTYLISIYKSSTVCYYNKELGYTEYVTDAVSCKWHRLLNHFV